MQNGNSSKGRILGSGIGGTAAMFAHMATFRSAQNGSRFAFAALAGALMLTNIKTDHLKNFSVLIDTARGIATLGADQTLALAKHIGHQHILNMAGTDIGELDVNSASKIFQDIERTNRDKHEKELALGQAYFSGALEAVKKFPTATNGDQLKKVLTDTAAKLRMADSDIVVEVLEHLDPDGRMPQQDAAHQSHDKRVAAEA